MTETITLTGANADIITITQDGADPPYGIDYSTNYSGPGGITLLDGVTGLDMPPVATTATVPVGWDGSLLQSTRLPDREVFLPLLLHADTRDDMRTLKRRLAQLLSPKTGDVTVTVNHSDAVRQIDGRFASGFDGPVTGDGTTAAIGVVLRCSDPWWQAPETTVEQFDANPSKPLLSTTQDFFPMEVTGSQAIGDVTITNPGDADAWPVIDIVGPGTDLVMNNATLGLSFGLSSVGIGETLTVDTRRGVQTLVDDTGAAAWDRLTPGSQLWPLAAGDNDIDLLILSTDTTTQVVITYRALYWTAW